MTGSYEFRIFGGEWAQWKAYFSIGNCIYITGRIEPHKWRKEELDLHIANIQFLADVREKSIERITISIQLSNIDESLADELSAIVMKHPGKTALFFNFFDMEESRNVCLHAAKHDIDPCMELIDFLDTHPALEYSIN